LFRLAFASAPGVNPLTSPQRSNTPAHTTTGTQSHVPGSEDPGIVLSRFVSTRFQVLFHSPSGVLFTFPSRYLSAIGHQEYLVLPNGLGRFPRDSACPVVLGKSARRPSAFRLRGYHPLWPPFPGTLG